MPKGGHKGNRNKEKALVNQIKFAGFKNKLDYYK